MALDSITAPCTHSVPTSSNSRKKYSYHYLSSFCHLEHWGSSNCASFSLFSVIKQHLKRGRPAGQTSEWLILVIILSLELSPSGWLNLSNALPCSALQRIWVPPQQGIHHLQTIPMYCIVLGGAELSLSLKEMGGGGTNPHSICVVQKSIKLNRTHLQSKPNVLTRPCSYILQWQVSHSSTPAWRDSPSPTAMWTPWYSDLQRDHIPKWLHSTVQLTQW